MITTIRRDWILAALTAAAPVTAVAGARHLSGAIGPAGAEAAQSIGHVPSEDAEDPFEPVRPGVRFARVDTTRAATVREAARAGAASWDGALFPAAPIAMPAADPTQSPDDTAAPVREPHPLHPGAAAYNDRFLVSSLMAARDGAIAVIDRKLRRLGDDVGSGVIVEAIDLDTRQVRLRTPDGIALTRRTAR